MMKLFGTRMGSSRLLIVFVLFHISILELAISQENFHNLTSGNSKASKDGKGKRNGKQFLLPFVVLPYSSQQQYHQTSKQSYHHPSYLQQNQQQYQPSHYSYNPFQTFFIPQNFPYQQYHFYPSSVSSVQQQYNQQAYSQFQLQSSQHHPHQQQPLSIRTDNVEHVNQNQKYSHPSSSSQSSSSLPITTATHTSTEQVPYIYHNRDVPPVISIHSALSPVESRQMEESLVIPEPLHMNEIAPIATTAKSTKIFYISTIPPAKNKASVSCKTKNHQIGTCKPFADCFPMFEMQYGNEQSNNNTFKQHNNGDNDMARAYMSSPLAEQLVENTNASICVEQEARHYVDQNDRPNVVCCPRFDLQKVEHRVERLQNGIGNYYGFDRHVNFPSITQRPPLRSKVISREYIQKQMCGQSKFLRAPGKIGKKDGMAIPKITGGVEATGPKEFPWMVAVFGKNRRIFCGASLITDRFLLSAAHCFSTFAPSDIKNIYVHLGDFNLRTTFDGPHEVRRIEKVIIHKGFKIQTYVNDIALLKLDKPVNFTDRISPICLPEPTVDLLEKETVVVTGWGRKFRYGTTSDTLRKVEMPVWNHGECKRVYDTFAPGRLLDTNICAGDGKRNKDACLGDSGGPAIFYDGLKWVQVGITSWGKGCGNFPGVYTRVDKYLMWITKNLEQYH